MKTCDQTRFPGKPLLGTGGEIRAPVGGSDPAVAKPGQSDDRDLSAQTQPERKRRGWVDPAFAGKTEAGKPIIPCTV